MSTDNDRKLPDITPNPEHASEAKRRFEAFGRELEQLMHAREVGGVLILASRELASWTLVMPKWGGLQIDALTGDMQVRINSMTPEAKALGDATIGFIASMRDIAAEVTSVFGSLFDLVRTSLRAQGADIILPPQGSPGHIGPSGRIKH